MPIRFIAALLLAAFAVSCICRTSAEYSSVDGPDVTSADTRPVRVRGAVSWEERSSESPSDVTSTKESSTSVNPMAEKLVRTRAVFDPSASVGDKHAFLTEKHAGIPTYIYLILAGATAVGLGRFWRYPG